MYTARPRRLLAILVVLLFWAGPAQAALVPYLDVIGWDQLRSDPQFSHLTHTGGLGQSIAVLDTGIDPEHLMFADVDGRERLSGGENFVDGSPAPIATDTYPYADGNNHGTFVSSVTAGNPVQTGPLGADLTLDGQTFEAGTQLELGGVAPGSDLVALRVLDNEGSGSFQHVLDGLNWILDHHEDHDIRVVNLSLGTTNTFIDAEDLLQEDDLAQEIAGTIDLLKEQSIPVVAAAGNVNDEEGLAFPAILDNVISVGASSRDPGDLDEEHVAGFTNRNGQLDLMAPGVDVLGALARSAPDDANTLLGLADGTSFAAPQVAAAIALVNEVFEDQWGRQPTYDELYYFVTFSQTTVTDPQTDLTFPRLDLPAALNQAVTAGDLSGLWVGAGNDGQWTTAGNWASGAVPDAGTELVFSGTDQTHATNDLAAGTNFAALVFAANGGAFVLDGNHVVLDDGGAIRNQSANRQTLRLDIVADGDMTIEANAGPFDIEGDLTLPAAGELLVEGGRDTNVAGSIGGGGNLVKAGAGTLTLSGNNTYTNGTEIREGTLVSVGNALPDAGAVDLAGGSDATLALDGDEVIGSLTGADGSTVDLADHTLTVGDGSNSAFAGTLTGNNGSLQKQGSGTLRLTGTNTYTGATRVLEGTLVAQGRASNLSGETRLSVAGGATFELEGDDETIGVLAGLDGPEGTIRLNDNTLTVAGAADSAFAGTVDGSGGMRFDGGTAIVHDLRQATLDYTGTTRIRGGQVLFPDGNVPGDFENAGVFSTDGQIGGDVFNRGRFGGNATVQGRFTNDDGGTLAPGHSIGTTTVNGSFEALAGSTFEVEVEGAGSEGGSYEVTDADLLKVNATDDEPGTAMFRSGSAIRVRELEDGRRIEHDNEFRIVDAEGGVTLEDEVELVSPSVFVQLDFAPTFENGNEMLLLTASRQSVFENLSQGASRDTQRVGAALDSLFADDEDDALIRELVTLIDSAPAGLESQAFQAVAPSVGPQAYDAAPLVVAENARMMNATLAGHFAARRRGLPARQGSDPPGGFAGSMLASAADDPWTLRTALESRERMSQGPASDWRRSSRREQGGADRRWNVFARGFKAFQNQDTSSDRLGYSADSTGFLAGFDYGMRADLDAGLSLGYTRAEVDLDNRRGEHDIDTFRVGPHVSYAPMPWFVDASLTYGYHRFETDRRMPTLGLNAQSRHNGHDLSAYAGGGYRFEFDRLHITPMASLHYLYLYEQGYTESGPGALAVDSRSTDSLRSRLGVSLDYRIDVDAVQLIPEIAVGWEHEYLAGNGTTRARFAAGGNRFATTVADHEKDALLFSAGLSALFRENISAFLRYDGRYHSRGDTHSGTGGLSIRF